MTDGRICLITPTWSRDLDHFRLLRASLDRSALADVPHHVIVQTEDIDAFSGFDCPAMKLQTTADVLPPEVETARRRACRISGILGRHLTRISGSMRREWGWPHWPAYTGWHTQQICKLMAARHASVDQAIIIDSDVIVTPNATVADFRSNGRIRCFATWRKPEELGAKVRKWIRHAEYLTGHSAAREGLANSYFDTPFILDRSVLDAMLLWLESNYNQPWWQVLLSQPPRRWSEFGIYKAFLAGYAGAQVDWCAPDMHRYLFDASDIQKLVTQVETLIRNPEVHYITIHSQSNGRRPWSVADYGQHLQAIIARNGRR
jgi:hypothetical protein